MSRIEFLALMEYIYVVLGLLEHKYEQMVIAFQC